MPQFSEDTVLSLFWKIFEMIRSVLVICCVYAALTPFMANAMTAEQKAQIHEHFENIGKMCIKDNLISAKDIADLRAKQVPSGPNSGCFLACIMRQIGIMDDAGMVQKETALELAKSIFSNEEELKMVEDYLHSCSHVNSAEVSDGEKGCERSMIAYKCMRDNAPQFGLDI